MLTNKDRQNLLDDFKALFITKDEWKMELLELNAQLLTVFVTKDEFQHGIKEIKNLVMTSFDATMGELKAVREDNAALNYRVSEHSDQLENHETRLSVLEKITPNVQP